MPSYEVLFDDEGPEADAFTAPAGHVFVLGDHRSMSNDGRNPMFGPVPLELLRGRATYVYYSPAEGLGVRAIR